MNAIIIVSKCFHNPPSFSLALLDLPLLYWIVSFRRHTHTHAHPFVQTFATVLHRLLLCFSSSAFCFRYLFTSPNVCWRGTCQARHYSREEEEEEQDLVRLLVSGGVQQHTMHAESEDTMTDRSTTPMKSPSVLSAVTHQGSVFVTFHIFSKYILSREQKCNNGVRGQLPCPLVRWDHQLTDDR